MKYSGKETININAPFQRGLSLIELMISITIGLIILTAMSTLFINQSKTRTELDKSNRMIDNGRYAMELLADEVRLAGYWGEFIPPNPSTCSAFPVPIWGVDTDLASSIPSSPYAEIPTASLKAGGDMLTIRRASTATPTAQTAAVAGVQYLQASVCQYDVLNYKISTTPADFTLRKKNCTTTSTTPYADLRRMVENVYFISPHNVSGDGIPTLKRLETDPASGARVLTPLVEGIEYMQIEYGVDNSSSFVLTATTTGGGLVLTDLSANPVTARLKPGMGIYSDPKIPSGYTVDTMTSTGTTGTITLKKEPGSSPIVTGTLVPLTTPYMTATAITGNAGMSILKSVNPKLSLAGLGNEVCAVVLDAGADFGKNALPAGTTIASMDASSITLSQNAIKSGTVRLDIPAIAISPKPLPGDGVADIYTAAPTTDQWLNVVSVKIIVLARNTEQTKGYTDTKVYTLGRDAAGNVQTIGPIGDSYKRHVYTQFIRLVNTAGRREEP